MSVQMWQKANSNLVKVEVQEKLRAEDYDTFVPELEKAISEHGKIRVQFDMKDFEGWQAGALWKDLKFDVQYFDDIERVAFVGETDWQRGLALFSKPFTTAEVKYFDRDKAEQAEAWLSAN